MTPTRPQLPRRERTRSARLTVVAGMLVTLVGLLGVTLSTAATHLGDEGPVPMAQLAGEEAVAGFDLAVISLGSPGVRDAGVHDAVDVVRRTRPDVVVLSGIDAHRLEVLREGLPGFGFWPEKAPAQGGQRQFAWRLSAFDPVATGLVGGWVDEAAQASGWVHLEQRSTCRSVVVVSGDSARAGSAYPGADPRVENGAGSGAGDGSTSAQDRAPRRAVIVVSPTDVSAAAHERVVGIGALRLRPTGARGVRASGAEVRTVRVALIPRHG